MRLPGIRSPENDQVRFFHFAIRAGAAAHPEYRRQTDDAGGASSSVATVDVVTADDHRANFWARKFKSHWSFSGNLRSWKALRTVLLHGTAKAPGRTLQRFVPGSGKRSWLFSRTIGVVSRESCLAHGRF